jgi:hypothetical protein
VAASHDRRHARDDAGHRLNVLRRWVQLLDSAYEIPFLGIRFGWDPILGLVPGLGDLVTPAFAIVLLVHAMSIGVPRIVQLRMLLNIAIDTLVGLVPGLGDLFDVAWKANLRNLRLLERHAAAPRHPTTGDWVFVGCVLAAVVVTSLLPLAVIVWLVRRFGWF